MSARAITCADQKKNTTHITEENTQNSRIIITKVRSRLTGVLQATICLIGLFANTVSIPVLKTKDLYQSTFNRLLIVLAIIDNLYLMFAFLECIRSEIKAATGDLHTTLFAYALYPLHNVMLCLSIYMTVILAMERYRAVTKPIDYHTVMVSGRQWQRVFHYVIPVVVFSLVFNMPKFFELETMEVSYENETRVRLLYFWANFSI